MSERPKRDQRLQKERERKREQQWQQRLHPDLISKDDGLDLSSDIFFINIIDHSVNKGERWGQKRGGRGVVEAGCGLSTSGA